MASVINLESGVDRTVRVNDSDCDDATEGLRELTVSYNGADHCSLAGALMLTKRLRAYWKARGEDRQFEAYTAVPAWCSPGNMAVNGVRALTPTIVPPKAAAPPRVVGPAPRQRIKAIIRQTLRNHIDAPVDDVMNRHGNAGKVSFEVAEARRCCVKAIRAAMPGLPSETIARIFNLDKRNIYLLWDDEARQRQNERTKAQYQRRQEQAAAA